jgi:hypothetical protein
MPMPRKEDPERFCEQCGAPMERRTINGRLEDRGCFLRRKFCCRECFARSLVKETKTKDAWRWRARRMRGDACEICGTVESLCAHHISGDITDNSPENLMTLCSACHTKWHWENGKVPWKRQSVCKICGAPARRLDMCQKHYQRFKKYGNPCLTKKSDGHSYRLVWDRG